MAVQAGRTPIAGRRARVSPWSRIYGFGSIYAKTLRDSRLAFLILGGMLGGIMVVVGAGVGSVYATPDSRKEIAQLVADVPPIMAGLTGKAVNVGTIGGYMAWKYGPVLAFTACLWSVFALSGTLASEARRGSLEFVASSPFGRRRIAIEKLAAHVTVMAGVMAVLAFSSWLVGAAFGKIPADAISPQSAIAFALWLGLVALASGSVAWALAPLFGRAAAAGIAGFVMVAGYMLNGYQASFPVLSGPANLTWFGWTTNHNPLGGQYDWVSLAPVAIVAVVFFAVGVEVFARRDLGTTSAIPTPSLPASILGLHGPTGRAFGERLPVGLSWGLGLSVFGLVIAATTRTFADELGKLGPDLVQLFRNAFPNFDVTTAGGFLQMFVSIGFIAFGFAAATLVAGWASDETAGRLEMLLATPLSHSRWAVSGGIGVLLVIAVMTGVFALGVGIGAIVAGSEVLTPVVGTVILGLYAAALSGVGVAIGGLFRTSIAAEVVALVVTVTFLIDLIAPALRLPDWVHQLAITAHLGQPMVGAWDPAGIVACLVITAGGIALGALGMSRRDVSR